MKSLQSNLIKILILCFLSNCSCQSQEDYLIKVHEGDVDEVGIRTGYVNTKGDTLIPLGKYYYCFTDTLKNFAIVLKDDGSCVAIDRNEKELFEVYWFDNGPDYISDGLFRIRKEEKIGYANEEGRIIITPQFECADPFLGGKARVTYKCELTPDGEHERRQSNDWFYIDKAGNRIL